MTFFWIALSLVTFAGGQLLLKLALNRLGKAERKNGRSRGAAWIFAASIFSMAVSFFLTLWLLQMLDLSYLFPFQGLSIMVIASSSAVFLKEKMTLELAAGVLLITAGVILVSST